MARLLNLFLPIAFTMPTAAFADITALQAWESLTALQDSLGTTMTARLEQDGDTVIAHDLKITTAQSALHSYETYATFPEMVLQGQANGEVIITLPQAGTYVSNIPDGTLEGLDNLSTEMSISLAGPIVVRGTPEALTHSFDANTLNYAIAEEGALDGAAPVGLEMIVAGISGDLHVSTEAALIKSTFDLNASTVESTMTLSENTGTAVAIAYHSDALAITGQTENAVQTWDNPADALQALSFDLDYSFGGSTFDVLAKSDTQNTHASGTIEASQVSMAMDSGGLAYSGSAAGLEVQISGSSIPFPTIDFGIKTVGFGLEMPIAAKDVPQPASIEYALEGLRLPVIAWAFIDPQNELPHDPANLRFNLSADILSQINLMDPVAFAGFNAGDVPVLPTAFNLNELYLSIAGAELIATGEGTVEQEGYTYDQGAPKVEAKAHIELNGSTALLDVLGKTGLVPPQLAASATLMLGLFAKPTDTPDGFETDVALSKDGNITVNGLPLPF